MTRIVMQMGVLFAILVSFLRIAPTDGQEVSKENSASVAKPAAKSNPTVIAKLIEQLGSEDFATREKASQQLADLDEVPEALRRATKDADLEVARLAQAAITIITDRAEERVFQAMLRDLHQVELDRFVRRIVTEKKFGGEKEWKIVQAITKAVTAEANKSAGRRLEVPEFDVNTMPRLLFNGETKNPVSVSGTIVLSTGATPYITSVRNSLVVVDGDFTGATGIDNSLLIVRGNVGYVTSVTNSIILATGNWEGATCCQGSFVQVNNYRIRFTSSSDDVLIKTMIRTTGATNSRVLDTQKGPLRLLKFSPRPSDAQLVWSQEVNNLSVAITPVDQKDQYLIRWKNVGKDALQLPWVRLRSDIIDENRDDLLGHVFLKGPDGKLVPARKYPAPQPLGLERSVILGPGQTHEETINLWSYLAKPAESGDYRLSFELDIPKDRQGREGDLKTWSGKIQSTVLEVPIGK